MSRFDKYFLMNVGDVIEYALEKTPDMRWDRASMQAREIGDGNLNYVFRVWDAKGTPSLSSTRERRCVFRQP